MCVIETETETKPDPFQRAFELCHELRAESSKDYEFREEYLDLAAKCEQFSADLLGQTRDSAELKTVLSHDSKMSKRGVGKEGRPMKVMYAVQRQHKKFVVHPHCQTQLIELWYRGLENWRDSSWIRNVVISTLIILAFPVLGLLYLIYPYGRYGRFMRIPYVKFLMHSASYMWFLAFLFMTTTHLENRTEENIQFENERAKLEYQKRMSEQRGSPPTKVELLIVIWIVGMTWRELREMWSSGLSDYLTNPWNILDLIQLTLYWAWLGFRITSIIMLYGSSIDLVDTFFGNPNISTLIPFGNISTFGGFGGIVFFVPNETALQSDFDSGIDYVSSEYQNSETPFTSPRNATINPALKERLHEILDAIAKVSNKIETSATYEEAIAKISLQLESINQAVSDLAEEEDSSSYSFDYMDALEAIFDDFKFAKPRGQWDQYDPTLLADLIMAVANVISVIRFLRVMVINEYVGPLMISVGKMLTDIMKFMFIFGLVWVAFALGLTQVYWGYGPESMLECMEEDSYAECYGRRFFADISASLTTLFWSLYGLIDLEALQVEADHLSTEFVGGLLFACYQIAAVLILLNLLIALMGTTYDSIVENADTEWKFYRSDMWMDYFCRGVTQAPPFNVLPSSKVFINVLRRVYHCCCCRRDAKVQAKAKRRSESAKESQEYYEVVCRRLIQRYLAGRSADCSDNSDCSYASRSDLSAFRSEICDMIQTLEQSIGQLREELRDKMPGINDSRQQDESSVTIENEGTIAEVQPSVSEQHVQSAD
ncbi:short transient receptor potential channel 5-like isoform X2 [Ptychodera flava]